MKKFKDIKAIKTNPEPAKGKNVDPDQLGQYSAKYQVSESTASLNQYLSARGINPQFVSTATKIAHSKSAQFLKWKQDHMQRREDVQASELTPEETVNEVRMDQISPAMQAHVKKGRVGSLNVGTRMSSPKPAFKPKPKPKKVGFFKRLFAGEEVQLEASKASKPTALERFRAAAAVREKKHNDIEKERQERLHQEPSKSNVPDRETKKDYMSAAIDRLEKHLNNEEVEQIMNEMDTYPHPDSKEGKALMKAFKSSAKKDPTDLNAPGKSPTVKQTTSALLPMLNKSFKKSMKKEEAELDEMINEVLGKDASAGDWIHDFVHSDNPKFAGKSKAERKKMALGAYYGKQNEEFEQLDELKKATVFSWLKQQPVVPKKKPGMDKKAHNQRIKTHNKSWNSALDRLSGYKPTSEDMWQDTQAATQTPADGANGGNQVADRKRQMSKSARMIKDLYKRKGVVKEDMYDHEKEDKSVATYGKKPKMSQTDKKDSLGENKPQAAATLTGGTTLTGVKRDSIEIDPIMRNRPGQPNIDKKSGKKENNKNDK